MDSVFNSDATNLEGWLNVLTGQSYNNGTFDCASGAITIRTQEPITEAVTCECCCLQDLQAQTRIIDFRAKALQIGPNSFKIQIAEGRNSFLFSILIQF